MSNGDSRHVVLGIITGAHGIRGEVRLKSFTGEPAATEAAVIPELNDGIAAPVLEPVTEEDAEVEGPLFPFEIGEVSVGSLRNPFLPPAAVRRASCEAPAPACAPT